MALIRMCDTCGGVDDHPRHVHYDPEVNETSPEIGEKALKNAPPEAFAGVLEHIRDNHWVTNHMDCCKTKGCPDGSCDVIVTGKVLSLKGDDLRAHLTSGAVNHVGWELTNGSKEVAE